MPKDLISRLETRINSIHKESFWRKLQVDGDFIDFSGKSREQTYALRALSHYFAEILSTPLINRIYTIVVKMYNGTLKVLTVA
ncbi:hypothetical protein [Lysinibacillus xylanilyticus]|uniref:Uncharacterized protein n=1 Tax=Lysinibacillus xylanilyticus TaxID=582475 RepID=A0A2M9QA34_9BACI|nr:hypothetical protein [Lysinibacillus xylanilyticus]PJO44930.1 hypothetical protein CWD94_04395 [Lysinibacillus xylanilyticus]